MNNLQNLSYAPVEFVICAGKTQTETETENQVIYHLKKLSALYCGQFSVTIESCILPLHEDPIIFVLYTLVKFYRYHCRIFLVKPNRIVLWTVPNN